MTTLIGMERDEAVRVSSVVEGPKIYAFDCADFARLARSHRPAVLVLGARLGGNQARAVELVPALERECGGYTVLMTYDPTREEVLEAIRLGVFGTVDMTRDDWDRRLERIISASGRHRRAASLVRHRVSSSVH